MNIKKITDKDLYAKVDMKGKCLVYLSNIYFEIRLQKLTSVFEKCSDFYMITIVFLFPIKPVHR